MKLFQNSPLHILIFVAISQLNIIPQQTTAMSIQATDFQRVLNVVGEWYRRSFRDLLVNGQYAIHDIDRQQIPNTLHIIALSSNPLLELQLRGTVHSWNYCFLDLSWRDENDISRWLDEID